MSSGNLKVGATSVISGNVENRGSITASDEVKISGNIFNTYALDLKDKVTVTGEITNSGTGAITIKAPATTGTTTDAVSIKGTVYSDSNITIEKGAYLKLNSQITSYQDNYGVIDIRDAAILEAASGAIIDQGNKINLEKVSVASSGDPFGTIKVNMGTLYLDGED